MLFLILLTFTCLHSPSIPPLKLNHVTNFLSPQSSSASFSSCSLHHPLFLAAETKEMKAKVKGKYEAHRGAASAAFSITSGDLKLTATLTDATFSNASSHTGLALSLHKPGAFSLMFDVPKKDLYFKFINEVALMGQAVRLTYTHTHTLGHNGQMALAGSTNINAANKVGFGYEFCSGVIKMRYAYTHGDLEKKIVVETCLDLSKNAWEFAVTRWIEGRDSLMAVYHAASKELGIEWRRKSKVNGSFKVSASLNLEKQNELPKLTAESSWNYDI